MPSKAENIINNEDLGRRNGLVYLSDQKNSPTDAKANNNNLCAASSGMGNKKITSTPSVITIRDECINDFTLN